MVASGACSSSCKLAFDLPLAVHGLNRPWYAQVRVVFRPGKHRLEQFLNCWAASPLVKAAGSVVALSHTVGVIAASQALVYSESSVTLPLSAVKLFPLLSTVDLFLIHMLRHIGF